MPETAPFEEHTARYDQWFERHRGVYEAELAALKRLGADPDRGLAVGVGTGRFAAPLGFRYGVDPAPAMLSRARERGIEPVVGVAEALPVRDDTFDAVLFVTTICFVDDLERAFAAARRTLRPDGQLLLGFVDPESPPGRQYRERNAGNPFYRAATFRTTDEVRAALAATGFAEPTARQTVFGPLESVGPDEPVREGTGDGLFVALRAGVA